MAIWLTVTRLVTVANLLVLGALTVVWLRNHLRLHTRYTLGLLAFAALLVAQNGYALFLFWLDPTTSAWFTGIPPRYNLAFMALALLQFGALSVLAWLTLD